MPSPFRGLDQARARALARPSRAGPTYLPQWLKEPLGGPSPGTGFSTAFPVGQARLTQWLKEGALGCDPARTRISNDSKGGFAIFFCNPPSYFRRWGGVCNFFANSPQRVEWTYGESFAKRLQKKILLFLFINTSSSLLHFITNKNF